MHIFFVLKCVVTLQIVSLTLQRNCEASAEVFMAKRRILAH